MGYTLGIDLRGPGPVVAVGRPDVGTPSPGPRGPAPARDRAGSNRTELVPTPRAAGLTDLLDDLGRPSTPRGDGTTTGGALADVVAGCVDTVSAARGGRPDALVVSHPASWGPYRTGLLHDALTAHDLPSWCLTPDTLAIAAHVRRTGHPAVAAPARIAVLDVGEECTTVGVVRLPGGAGVDGAAVLAGPVEDLADLAAIDADDAVLAHVRAVAGDASPGSAGSLGREAAEGLRAACRRASDELLAGAAALVTWPTPGGAHPVRVVAADVEDRLRPGGTRAVRAAAAHVARTAPSGVDAVVLSGRLAPLPLLTELVAERFDAPVTVLPGGSDVAALGAAAMAGSLPRTTTTTTTTSRPVAGTTVEAGEPEPAGRRRRGHGRRAATGRPLRLTALAWLGAAVLGVLAVAVSDEALAGGDGPGHPPAGVVVDGTGPGSSGR